MAISITDYQIGRLEGDLTKPHKFIIEYRGEGILVYHSHFVDCDGQPFHKKIAQKFGIGKERVIGGGYVFPDTSCLDLCEYSTDFGAVPIKILKRFTPLILERYKSLGVEIINHDVDERNLRDWWRDFEY